MSKKEVYLGGCYHSGLAYALGYYASGEIELDEEIFTNINGGAREALKEHRRDFDPSRDVKRFIVALKPVEVIMDEEENEYDEFDDNAGCDSCGENDRIEGENLCEFCLEDETYDNCDEECCSSCDYCSDKEDDCCLCEDCVYEDTCYCEDELCDEFVADTFEPMNAFARARWLKAQRKGENRE